MIRILIADDQRLMRDGLATILNLEKDMEVIATASDGKEAFELACEHRPDVVLMDIRMPGVDGVVGTKWIRNQLPDCKVLILTTFQDSELIFQALEQGAHGYLLKDMPSEAIVKAIQTVYSGGMVLQPDITAQIMQEWKKLSGMQASSFVEKTPPENLSELLTERELDVLEMLGRGLNNKEIADHLFIKEGTVKNHVSSLIAKLELRDRTQAAVYAVRHGITKFDA